MVIIVPYADTADQQAAAYGTQFNVGTHRPGQGTLCVVQKDGRNGRSAKEKQDEWSVHGADTPQPTASLEPGYQPPPPFVGVTLPFGVVIGILSIVWVWPSFRSTPMPYSAGPCPPFSDVVGDYF
jgi:hypothetical protein